MRPPSSVLVLRQEEGAAVLYVEGVEIPSDYDGVVFVPMDDAGAWKMLIAKELKAAGFGIDMNKAV